MRAVGSYLREGLKGGVFVEGRQPGGGGEASEAVLSVNVA